MSQKSESPPASGDALAEEIAQRMGVVPHFFCSVPDAPEVTEELWRLAERSYLDLPLSALFKERLFVYLSRFCEARYCVVRHCGFLLGCGRVAGDPEVPPMEIRDALELLTQPAPTQEECATAAEMLHSQSDLTDEMLQAGSPAEHAVLHCAAWIFLAPGQSGTCRSGLRTALGARRFEHLLTFIAFIRTAHFWTLTHPELEYEEDIVELLEGQHELAEALLAGPGSEGKEAQDSVSRQLTALRDEQNQFRALNATHRELEHARNESLHYQNLLATVINEMPVGVSVAEAPSGRALFKNEAVDRLTGQKVSERKHMKEYGGYGASHEDGRPYSSEEYPTIRALTLGERVHNEEMPYLHPERGRITLLLNSAPIRDASGRISAAVTAVHDITEIKATQEALSEAVRSRDEFLSIASHELKTPLTSLRLQVDLHQQQLQKNPEFFSPKRIGRLLDYADRQTSRLTRLVNDMLDLARIRTGRLSLGKEEVELCELVESKVQRFTPVVESEGASISCHCESRLQGEWDRFRIEQVIANLLTNAMRYGEGSSIEVRVSEADGMARVSVSDRGRGIEAAARERIFERFERAVSESEVSGLGLGLFISRQIVEQHGGRIWAESEGPGQGATFFMDLPLAKVNELAQEGREGGEIGR